MTIDDETSVYVGNLPYDATEDTIRSVFDLYGQIIAVKLINDRGVGGKCYGFVTYTNPRSAVDAISDMDGRTVNGRVVKVNEVKTRGRSGFSHDNYRQNNYKDVELDRRTDRDRDRDRDRDYGRVRDRSRDQNRDFSRDRDHGKERGFDHSRDIDRTRDRFIDRDRGYDRDKDMVANEREKDHDQTARDYRSGNKHNDQTANLTNGSDFSERHSREHPSGSSHEDPDQVAKQLAVSRHKIEELQKEVFRMEELLEERGDYVSQLQEKSQKLEDALASTKKITLNRKKQLIKLHKCFLNVKEYGEKLRSSEEELQFLVGSSMKELEAQLGPDIDGQLAHGNGLAD